MMKRKMVFTTTTLLSILLLSLLVTSSSSFSTFFVSADPITSCGDHSSQSGVVTLNTLGSSCSELTIRDSTVDTIVINAQSNIANLTIRNIICQRSSAGACINFNGAVTSIEHVEIDDITYTLTSSNLAGSHSLVHAANPITGAAASSTTNKFSIKHLVFSATIDTTSSTAVFGVCFNAAVSQFNNVSISDIVFEDFNITVSSGTSTVYCVDMTGSATVTGTGTSTSSFSINNVTQKNISLRSSTSSTVSGDRLWGLLIFQLVDFSNVSFSVISQESCSFQSGTEYVSTYAIYFFSAVTGTNLASSSFAISDVTQRHFNMTGNSTYTRVVFQDTGDISGFNAVAFTNIHSEDITASALVQYFSSYALILQNAIVGAGFSDSSFSITNVSQADIQGTAPSLINIYCIRILDTISNFSDSIIISDFTQRNITASGASSITVRGLNFGTISGPNQQLLISNAALEHDYTNQGLITLTTLASATFNNVIIADSTLATVVINSQTNIESLLINNITCERSSAGRCAHLAGAVTNIQHFEINSITYTLTSTSVSGGHYLVYVANPVTGAAASSSTNRLLINNAFFSSTIDVTSSSQVSGVYINAAISQFNSFSISDIALESFTMTVSSGYARVFGVYVASTATVTGTGTVNASFTISNVSQKKITLSSSSSDVMLLGAQVLSALSGFSIVSLLSIFQELCSLQSETAYVTARPIYIADTITGTDFPSSSFSISDVTQRHLNLSSSGTYVTTHVIDVYGILSGFNSMSFSSILAENITGSASTNFDSYALVLRSSINGNGDSNSSFSITNITHVNVNATATTSINMYCLHLQNTISNFSDTITISDFTQRNITASGASSITVRGLTFATISGPTQQLLISNAALDSDFTDQGVITVTTLSSGTFNNVTIADSTVAAVVINSQTNIDRLSIRNIICQRNSAGSCVFFGGAISDVQHVEIGNITYTLTSSNIAGTLSLVYVANPITAASASSGTNSFSIKQLTFSSTIDAGTASVVIGVYINADISQFNSISISEVVLENLTMTVSSGYARVYGVDMSTSATVTGTGTPTASFFINNVSQRHITLVSSSNYVDLIGVRLFSVSGFSTVSLSAIFQESCVFRSATSAYLYNIYLTGTITGTDHTSSSFSVSDASQQHFDVSGNTVYVRVVESKEISGFNTVSFSNILSENITGSASALFDTYAIVLTRDILGNGENNSTFSVINVIHADIRATAPSLISVQCIRLQDRISNFSDSITISDFTQRNITASGASSITVRGLNFGTIAGPTQQLVISNATLEDDYTDRGVITLTTLSSGTFNNVTIADSALSSVVINSQTNVEGLFIRNITCQRSSAGSCINFDNPVTNIEHVEIDHVTHTLTSSNIDGNHFPVNVANPITAAAASSSTNSLSITYVFFRSTIDATSNSQFYGVYIKAAISQFNSFCISGIVLENFAISLSSGYTSASCVFFTASATVTGTGTPTSSFSIYNLSQKNVSLFSISSTVLQGVRIAPAISDFSNVSFSAISQESCAFKSGTGAYLYAVYFSSPIIGTGHSMSSFTIDNVTLNSISLSSTSGSVDSYALRIASPLSGFSFVTIKDFSISNITVNAATAATVLALSFGTSDSNSTLSIQCITMDAIRSLTNSLALAVFSPLPYFSPSTVAISDSTLADLPSPCTSSNCSFLLLEENSLVKGDWNFTNVSSSSPSLISATSSSAVFDPSAHFTFDDSYIEVTSDIITQSPSLNLNSSSWTILCSNRWSRSVEVRLQSVSLTDSSNPSINIEKCTHTHSHTISETKYFPQAPTTTFASTLVPLKQYSPIPADLTEYPSFTPPATTQAGIIKLDAISGTTTIKETIKVLDEFVSTGTSPATVTIRSADPTLGTFVSVPENIPSSVTPVLGDLGNNITFTATNLTELAIAVKNGYVYSVSPEAEAKNLTEGTYIEVVAKDAGDQQGQTSILLRELEINQGPIPQYPDSVQATFNVTRGNRFVLNLNSTFVHHQNLQMYFAAHLTDLFPLPRTVALQCLPEGNCTIRGVIETEDPLHIEIQSSDNFILRASYITLVPIVVPIHINENIEMKPILFRPGQQFTYALPTNLFLSSTAIEYTAVRLASGFLLPSTMVFDAPNILRGQYNEQGLLHLQVRASDLFSDAVRNFTLNFTNVQPFCRNDFTNLFPTEVAAANSSIPNIAPVAALQEFERTIEFSQVCADNDNDPLQFEVNPFGLPTWLRYGIQPGGATTLPQVLRISGTPPQRAENSLLLINITVTDLFSTLILSVPLRIAENQPPRLLRPLPNYTIHPGDVESFTIDLRQHFEDPNDDPFIITTKILTDYAKTWLQVTTDNKNFLYLSMKPPDEIAGEADDAQDSDDQLLVRIEDPFGNYTESKINIYTRLTTWQKLRTAVYIIAGLFSAFLSVLSTILLYPYVVNFFRAGSTQIPCPLNARNRKWMIPENATVVEIRDRTTDDVCMWLRNKAKFISVWLYDEITTEEFPHGDPPIWCEKIDKGLKLNNIEREPGTLDVVQKNPVYDFCFVRIYNRRGIILVQFAMKYHEITRGWDFERVEKEEAEEQRQLEIKAGIRIDDDLDSEISINFDSDDFGLSGSRTNPINTNFGNNNNNNNNPDESRWKHLDTKMMSIDMQLSEGFKESEMKTIKLEQELKNENQDLKQELSTLKSMMQSLLQNHSPPTANTNVNDFSNDLDNHDDDYNNYDNNNDDDDEVDLTDILGSPSLSLPPPQAQHSNEFDETLEGMDLADGKAYRAKGEYDRDLEELLDADARKKEQEKKKTVTTFNPIKRELEESTTGFSKSKKFAESTKM